MANKMLKARVKNKYIKNSMNKLSDNRECKALKEDSLIDEVNELLNSVSSQNLSLYELMLRKLRIERSIGLLKSYMQSIKIENRQIEEMTKSNCNSCIAEAECELVEIEYSISRIDGTPEAEEYILEDNYRYSTSNKLNTVHADLSKMHLVRMTQDNDSRMLLDLITVATCVMAFATLIVAVIVFRKSEGFAYLALFAGITLALFQVLDNENNKSKQIRTIIVIDRRETALSILRSIKKLEKSVENTDTEGIEMLLTDKRDSGKASKQELELAAEIESLGEEINYISSRIRFAEVLEYAKLNIRSINLWVTNELLKEAS